MTEEEIKNMKMFDRDIKLSIYKYHGEYQVGIFEEDGSGATYSLKGNNYTEKLTEIVKYIADYILCADASEQGCDINE